MKKIIILISLFLLMINIVVADYGDQPLLWYKFNTDGNLIDYSPNGQDITEVGTVPLVTTGHGDGSARGLYETLVNEFRVTSISTWDCETDLTISAWINRNVSGNDAGEHHFLDIGTNSVNVCNAWFYHHHNDNQIEFRVRKGTDAANQCVAKYELDEALTFGVGTWQYIVGTYNQSSKVCKVYWNATLGDQTDTLDVATIQNATQLLVGGYNDNDAHDQDKYMVGEIEVHDFCATPTQITDDYNNHVGVTGYMGQPVDAVAPLITFVYPDDGETYKDYDGWINWTTDEAANCSMSDTNWVKNQTTTPTSKKYYNTDYSNIADGNYTVNVSCWDGLKNNGTSSINFIIDNTFPYINSNLQNNDTLNLYNTTFQINITDNLKLFSLNITATDYSYYEDNINRTFYSFNGTVDMINYSVGEYEMNITFCDAHTAKEIGTWKVNKDQTIKEIKFNDKLSIKPKNPSHFDSFSTTKKFDRYEIEYTKKQEYKAKDETYIVTGDNLHIIGDELYTGWMVDSSLKKWIDFENDNNYKATLKRNSKNEIEVTTKAEKFKSAGDLNCNSTTYKFYRFNYSVDYASSVSESSIGDYKLKLNLTGIPLTITSSSTFQWNSTDYATTKKTSPSNINFSVSVLFPLISNTSTVKNFIFNFTLNQNDYDTGLIPQTIYQLYLDSCGGLSNTTAINYTGYDELTNSQINTSFSAYYEVYKVGGDVYRNYTFNFTSRPTHQICLLPTDATLQSDYVVEYKRTGYATRYYIRRNATITANKKIPLFLLTSGNATSVTVHATNTLDEPIPNILIEMYNYNILTAKYSLVETRVTNSEGEGIFSVVYTNSFYLFKLFEETTQRKADSTHYQITTLDLYYILYDEIATGLETWIEFRGFEPEWSYNNNTRKINLTWGSFTSSMSAVNWIVEHSNGTEIVRESSTVEDSYFQYSFPNTNMTYIASTYITDTDGNNYTTIKPRTINLDFSNLWKQDPMESLTIGFFMLMIIGLLGFFKPAAGVITTTLAVIAIFFFSLIPSTITAIYSLAAVGILLIAIMGRKKYTA